MVARGNGQSAGYLEMSRAIKNDQLCTNGCSKEKPNILTGDHHH